MPPALTGDTEEKLEQLRSYLLRLASEIETQVNMSLEVKE